MPIAELIRIPLDPAWFDAIPSRVSRRVFDGRPIDPAVVDRVESACERLSASAAGRARAVLVRAMPEGVFKGIVGGYGAVTGAPAFVAFIGREDTLVDVGCLGEAVVLEATAAGLDTCWIAGTFDAGRTSRFVTLAEDEAVRAVTPLGYGAPRHSTAERLMHAVVKPRVRLPLDAIAAGVASWPAWARAAAEAVRLAPSGGNGQPWRLRLEGGALVFALKPRPYWTGPIDSGIAMLHAELGAMHAGVSGLWERLAEPDVARFTPQERR